MLYCITFTIKSRLVHLYMINAIQQRQRTVNVIWYQFILNKIKQNICDNNEHIYNKMVVIILSSIATILLLRPLGLSS